jgi:threonine aldolase
LIEDHRNARLLAEALAAVPGLSLDLDRVDTNIVMVDVADAETSAETLQQRASERGLLFFAMSPVRFRLVTHLDVSRDDCGRAAQILTDLMGGA